MAFAASTIIAGLGVGLAGVGLFENYTNSQKASGAQASAALKQGQIAGLQASNVDVQKQQLDLTTNQQLLQTQTQRSVIQDQSQADAIRQQAATLDATRRQREAVRSGIVARAQGLATATNEGANEVGSTGFRQAEASITGQANTNIQGVTQNLDLTSKLYSINKDITSQYLSASYKNDEFVGQSKELQGQVLDTQKQIYSLGGSANSDYATAAIAQGNASMGAGLLTLGSSIVNNFDKINSLTNYFTTPKGTSTNNSSTSTPGNLNFFG